MYKCPHKRYGHTSEQIARGYCFTRPQVVPLRLTNRQEAYASRCIGVSRSVYNIMVAGSRLHKSALGTWPNALKMRNELVAMKKELPEFAYLGEVSKFVLEGAAENYATAVRNACNPSLKAKAPAFRKRRATGAGSFLAAGSVGVARYDGKRGLRLPYLGKVRLVSPLREHAEISRVVISKRNGKWYASLNLRAAPPELDSFEYLYGGVDVGIAPLAVDSDGSFDEGIEYENPKALSGVERRLKMWQRKQSRRRKGSCGWWKAQRRIDGLHRRVVGIRKDNHHQVSRELARKFFALGIESLNVSGMSKLRYQAKAISDAGIGDLLAQIRYKKQWYGGLIVQADRWYPSSKKCSVCGDVNRELERQPRWVCSSCSVEHERNHNAARNLARVALGRVEEILSPSSEVTPVESTASVGVVVASNEPRDVEAGITPLADYAA